MTTTIDDHLLRSLLPGRSTGTHKWEVGGTLIIAGSPSYPGAAWLACRSAGRSGAGIVYLAAPRSVIGTMASAMPEVAYIPLPDTDSPGNAHRARELMADVIGKVKSVVIGPGLGNDASTNQLLTALLGVGEETRRGRSGIGFVVGSAAKEEHPAHATLFEMTSAQIVLDADALNWLAGQGEWWTTVPANRLVLTPHPGEAQRLADLTMEAITGSPAETAAALAKKWNQTVVIKSVYTAASNGKRTVQADCAPTSLATAGTGDCLAGAIGAWLAQGCAPIDAATLAIGIGSRAASVLEPTFGIRGVLASDLPDTMAQCVQKLSLSEDV